MVTLLTYEEVEKRYRHITARQIKDACGQPDGPRRAFEGIVSEEEVDAWIRRRERKHGVRT